MYHWVDVDRGATGVYAYLRNGNIYQLSVHTPRFALPNGVKTESSEEHVKSAYPKGRRYVLLQSGSAVVGGRDLVYWVDKGTGVAIELYWNQRKKQGFVNGIDIFERGDKLQTPRLYLTASAVAADEVASTPIQPQAVRNQRIK